MSASTYFIVFGVTWVAALILIFINCLQSLPSGQHHQAIHNIATGLIITGLVSAWAGIMAWSKNGQ